MDRHDHQMQYRPRQELHARLIAGFSALEEIHSIHVFGREVEGEVDEFSDVDMVVCSEDLRRTQERYLAVLNSISPIRATYNLVSTDRELVQMVMFRDYSPYQKVDFEITDDIAHKQGFGPFKCLYERARPAEGCVSLLEIESRRDTVANQLNDILFSIPRFTKCIFRRDRDLYRRWIGVTERLCVLLYESQFGWGKVTASRLSPPQYKAMHKALSAEDEVRLDAIEPLDGDPHLPESFRLATEWILELYAAKAAGQQERIDLGFAHSMRQFLMSELHRAGTVSAPLQMTDERPPARILSSDARR